MKILSALSLISITWIVCFATAALGEESETELVSSGSTLEEDPMDYEEEIEEDAISDPIESVNRVLFGFNDKLYFWVLKPVAVGYGKVLPEPARRGVRNFFSNVATPVRLVNCALQGNLKGAGIEVSRFAVNTTAGVAGFSDPAQKHHGWKKRREDFGQTLGRYGLGEAFYINWPILGPSNPRDTVGLVGDFFLDPVNYVFAHMPTRLGVKVYDKVNGTSLSIGAYEDLKEASIDPYVAVRDAYHQHRQYLVEDID